MPLTKGELEFIKKALLDLELEPDDYSDIIALLREL
tara:strand:+ start:494 stop:601 length:108 start_codon:yes stop_codon:yes gene_type:complete